MELAATVHHRLDCPLDDNLLLDSLPSRPPAGVGAKKKRQVAAHQDGVQLSYSESCISTSEEEESSETTNLEAPMKKKSMKNPGSVLAMLVGHIRS